MPSSIMLSSISGTTYLVKPHFAKPYSAIQDSDIHAVWFIRDTSIKDIVKSPDKLRDTLMRRLLLHTQLRDTALPKVSVSV